MKLTWNGDVVTGSIADIVVRDNAGGMADELTVVFPDPEQAYLNWKPQKGDVLMVTDDGWSSGAMYFDGFLALDGAYQATAISTPPAGKTEAYRAWQDVLFSHVARDIAVTCGLALELHGIPGYRYAAIAQAGEANLAFLNGLCRREGWALKVHDGRAVIFNERDMEHRPATLTLDRRDLGKDYEFGGTAAELKSRCAVRHMTPGGLVEYVLEVPGIYGGSTQADGCAANIGEAQRFARGALREANKYEYSGKFSLPMERRIAAGNTVHLTGLGALSGIWYLTRVEQRLVSGRTLCRCRRPIEGEY